MSQKGSGFERDICKQLSLWWTNNERDDVFWRTSGSGARATTRSKKGKATFGQYGDVQATDPIGQPLLDLVTIEIKRGYSKSSFADMLEASPKSAIQQFDKFIGQVISDSEKADTPYWWLITKRDRKEIWITFSSLFYKDLKEEILYSRLHLAKPRIRMTYQSKAVRLKLNLVGMPFSEFLIKMNPEDVELIISS